jgi:iron-sulfur cluster repair protein YtfE (RIC family)
VDERTAPAARRVDLIALLEDDHRRIEQIIHRLENVEVDERAPLVEVLTRELRVHMTVEEDLVYPAIAAAVDRQGAEESRAEHKLLREVLGHVMALSPGKPGFSGAIAMLKAGVQHHVGEEEDDGFPRLREALDEAQYAELGERVASTKAELADRGQVITREVPVIGDTPRRSSR